MQHLFWAAVFSTVLVFVSVVQGSELPDEITSQYENSSIEVGFSQDGEPEPHLLAIAKEGKVSLFELTELSQSDDRKPATRMSTPPQNDSGREMQPRVYMKRMLQAVEQERFFSAPQVRSKGRCKDNYVVRITQGSRFRERRGCSNQTNDPFAGLTQMVFRDAFLTYRQRMPTSSDSR